MGTYCAMAMDVRLKGEANLGPVAKDTLAILNNERPGYALLERGIESYCFDGYSGCEYDWVTDLDCAIVGEHSCHIRNVSARRHYAMDHFKSLLYQMSSEGSISDHVYGKVIGVCIYENDATSSNTTLCHGDEKLWSLHSIMRFKLSDGGIPIITKERLTKEQAERLMGENVNPFELEFLWRT